MSMSDGEVREALQKLTDRVGQMETEVRVLKHDFNNMQQTSQDFGKKIEKVEERVASEIKEMAKTMQEKFDVLTLAITALNIKQERSFGFFAGIGFVVISCGAVIIAAIKLLTG